MPKHVVILRSNDGGDRALSEELREGLEGQGFDCVLLSQEGGSVRDWLHGAGQVISKAKQVVLVWSDHAAQSAAVNAALSLHCEHPVEVFEVIAPGTTAAAPGHLRPVATCALDARKHIPTCLKTLGMWREPIPAEQGPAPGLRFYLAEMKTAFSQIAVLGEGNSSPMESVYQPLQIRADGDPERRIPIEGLLDDNAPRHSIIIGPPGSGKTTSLKFLGHKAMLEGYERIPIMTRLANFATRDVSLRDELLKRIKIVAFQAGVEDVLRDQAFLGTRYVVLLDGFDEVPEAIRPKVLRRISEFTEDHPNCSVVITSRPREIITDQFPTELSQFRSYQLLPLTDDDIRTYLQERLSRDQGAASWALLKENDRLLELARIPFLLALIAQFGIEQTSDSTNRSRLFDNCVKYFVGFRDWERAPGRTRPSLEKAQLIERVLKHIAVRFFKLDSADEFEISEILSAISEASASASNPSGLLEDIIYQTGLLQDVGELISFVHRSIWEYFVASAMLSEPTANVFDRAGSARWEEPIRLYVGLKRDQEQADVIRGLWKRNKALTLRTLSELDQLPSELLQDLFASSTAADRLQVLAAIDTQIDGGVRDAHARRLVVDTIRPIVSAEHDARVLFEAIASVERHAALLTAEQARSLRSTRLDLEQGAARRQAAVADPENHLEFELIPSGQFKMGGESEARPSWMDGPIHEVEISSFYMSRYCVTNQLYYDSGFPLAVDRRKASSNLPRQPVVGVTWFEAALFAAWLGCRLPTEAEWEYCCRAGGADDTRLADPEFMLRHAWYTANSGNQPHEVGLKEPNSFQLFDMLGNVREWCSDWSSDTYYEACLTQGVTRDPKGPMTGEQKVLRGGCFDWNILNLSPTYRNYKTPDEPYFANGFRIALDHSDPEIPSGSATRR